MPEQLNQSSNSQSEVDPMPLALGEATRRESRTLRLMGVENLRVVPGQGVATEEGGEGKIFIGPLRRSPQDFEEQGKEI